MKLCAEFTDQDTALAAHRALIDEGLPAEAIEIRSSYPLPEEAIPPHRERPFRMRNIVRSFWFLGGTLGFTLAAGSQVWWPIETSGHPIVSIPIDLLITYESAMITAVVTNTIFFFIETRPFRQLNPAIEEDMPVANGNIALVVEGEDPVEKAKTILDGKGARSIVTYALCMVLALFTLTGCFDVRMRTQPALKTTEVASGGAAEGAIAMPHPSSVQLPDVIPPGRPTVDQISQMERKYPAIPREVRDMPNPRSGPDSVSRGAGIFIEQCVFCHGQNGKGDGPVAELFSPQPANLLSALTRKRKDGSLFWLIYVGPTTMPAFGDRLSPEQIFDVVNFIRSLQAAEPEVQ